MGGAPLCVGYSADTNTFPVIVITLHYLLRLMNGNRILLCFSAQWVVDGGNYRPSFLKVVPPKT